MAFVKDPLNATEPREIIEYSQDLEDRVEEGFDDALRNVDILTNEKIIYGHRGCGYAPENTKAAISVGRSYGLKGFEIDVQPTSDNVWVCHHDLTVDRVTNGTGAVSDMTYAQFKNLNVTGGHFQSLFEGVKTMSLVEAISEVSQGDGNLYLDIKATPTREQLANLIEIIKSANMLRKTIFSAFNTDTRTMLRELSHEIVLGYSVYNMSYTDIDNAAALDNCLIDFDVNSTTDVENKVKYALSKNVPVFAWTVNEYESDTDIKSMRYLTKLGISGMTSDNFFGMKMTKTSRHITVRKVGSSTVPLISVVESPDLLYNKQFAVKDNGYYIRLHVPFYPKKSDQYKMNAENSESLGDGIIKPFITVHTWFNNRNHNLDREMYVEQATATGENYDAGQSAFETSCILKCRSLTTGDIIPPNEWEKFYAYITFDGWQLRDQ